MRAPPAYHLRLLARFVHYDPDHSSPLWREWPPGAIVDDPRDIELLEARGAPVERIEDPKTPISKGEIVTNNADMKLLEAHEAPIERIETDE